MALTAAQSPLGFKFERFWTEGEYLYVPADPGITITRQDNLAIGATGGAYGLGILATGSLADTIGVAQRSQVVPASTVAFPHPARHLPDGSSADLTLVPVRPWIPVGAPIFVATFTNHYDDTVISYATGAGSMSGNGAYCALTTGCGADDRPNGAFVYVYEGTGAGQVNIVDDYDHTGGTVELMLGFTRPFDVALDSTSKLIIVAGEAATNKGIGSFGRTDGDDEDALEADDGADDGDFVVLMDFLKAPQYLRNLTLPVINARHLFVS